MYYIVIDLFLFLRPTSFFIRYEEVELEFSLGLLLTRVKLYEYTVEITYLRAVSPTKTIILSTL